MEFAGSESSSDLPLIHLRFTPVQCAVDTVVALTPNAAAIASASLYIAAQPFGSPRVLSADPLHRPPGRSFYAYVLSAEVELLCALEVDVFESSCSISLSVVLELADDAEEP